MSPYRLLHTEEISQLEAQGCVCENWTLVKVVECFKTENIRSTTFSGTVFLGLYDQEIIFYGGIKRKTGIYNATIHNCTIGDNVYINNIKNYIANYLIESEVVIENVDIIALEGKSSFGNGTEVAILNEAGGREIPIFDKLSAQLTYILTFYRHRPLLIKNLKKKISEYTESASSSQGTISRGTKIINSRTIKNVKIGPKATVDGVDRLINGSINSCSEDPIYVGTGVIAENFIFCSGSRVSDSSLIFKCFVGQGCLLAKQYSAENSVFFANCGGFHGEAWSVFAGPYTVTHHKSTLLISGFFPFLNAGSGSNQSNHMYKLGPVHQGVIERGSKTGSDSYIGWPAKIGPFTVIMGRHYKNSDTADLPFSYLIENEDESVLVPGINLRSVGTIRDARKWPNRDRRKDPNKLDFINFNLLSPYTIQKMLNGIKILDHLRDTSGETSSYYTYNNVTIKNSSLRNGIDFYTIGIEKFLGNCLVKRLQGQNFKNINEIRNRLLPETEMGRGKWIDMAGLLVPEKIVQRLLLNIENDTLCTLDQIHDEFRHIHENYQKYAWTWAINVIQQRLTKTIEQMTANDIINMTEKWISSVVNLDQKIIEDAKKEFSLKSQIGFGLDGDRNIKRFDFEYVRGKFDSNSFVAEARDHIKAKTKLHDDLVERMNNIL